VLYHLTGYAGFPAANAARRIGREVLPDPQRNTATEP
jgi:alkylhydroperoxidase/carboxymuconolactone decarboxylase family protein YurZ